MNTYGFQFNNMIAGNSDNLATYRRPNGYYKSLVLVAMFDGTLHEVAEIRFYRTKSRNYACLWLTHDMVGYGQTGGMAGGYGYDREEAALSEAAGKHGITGDWFDGRRLLEALAAHLDFDTFKVIETYA